MSAIRQQAKKQYPTKAEQDAYFLGGSVVKATVIAIIYNERDKHEPILDIENILKEIENI